MMTARSIPTALLLCLALSARASDPPADAMSPAVPANAVLEPNAALRYWGAFQFLPQAKEDLELLENWEYAPLDDAAKRVLRSHVAEQYLQQGAQCAECNWGLNYDEGPALHIPQAGKALALARLACLDARYKFDQKQPRAAVDELCDVLAMARHLAQDKILISLLVRYRIEGMAITVLAAHLKELDEAMLARLEQRLGGLPRATSIVDSLTGERLCFIGWALRRIRSGEKTDWLEIYGNESDVARALQKDAQACVPQLEALDPYFVEGQKILAADLSAEERERQTAALRERLKDNPFAPKLFDEYTKSSETEFAAKTRFALFKAAIAVVQKGPDAVKSLKDPVLQQPLQYMATAKGFTLLSNVLKENERVSITVGPQN
jgi:hypothetical protein